MLAVNINNVLHSASSDYSTHAIIIIIVIIIVVIINRTQSTHTG